MEMNSHTCTYMHVLSLSLSLSLSRSLENITEASGNFQIKYLTGLWFKSTLKLKPKTSQTDKYIAHFPLSHFSYGNLLPNSRRK